MSNASDPCFPGPVPNSDVSGIGVRASFYAQAVLLALLSARSPNQSEITDALATLIITNLAICVTTLYLGFKPNPDLNLYDGLIVCYLLLASWSAIFFTLPQYNRFRKYDPHIKWLAVVQSYLVFGTLLAVLQTAPNFGSCNSESNAQRKLVIFGAFSAVHSGRVAGLVGASLLVVFYTAIVLLDYRSKGRRRVAEERRTGRPRAGPSADGKDPETPPAAARGEPAAGSPGTPRAFNIPIPVLPHTPAHVNTFSLGVDGRVLLHVVVILVVSTLAIVNTELLRHYNHPQPDDKAWGFGQILPMFLVVLPAKRTVTAFWEQGLSKKRPTGRGRRVRLKQRQHQHHAEFAPYTPGEPTPSGAPHAPPGAAGAGPAGAGGAQPQGGRFSGAATNPMAAFLAAAMAGAGAATTGTTTSAHIEEWDEDEDDEAAPGEGDESGEDGDRSTGGRTPPHESTNLV